MHRLTSIYAKNYQNRTLIVKVIVENVVTFLGGTQCRYKCLCTSMHSVYVTSCTVRVDSVALPR